MTNMLYIVIELGRRRPVDEIDYDRQYDVFDGCDDDDYVRSFGQLWR